MTCDDILRDVNGDLDCLLPDHCIDSFSGISHVRALRTIRPRTPQKRRWLQVDALELLATQIALAQGTVEEKVWSCIAVYAYPRP